MAARAQLDNPARPLLADDRFDIPLNLEVTVTTTEGYIIKGNCFRNPSKTNMTNCVELVNCRRHDPVSGKTSVVAHQRFFSDNIKKLDFRAEKSVVNPNDIPERLVATKIIATEDELTRLLSVLEDAKMIGLSMQGINVSRDGKVGWICVYTRGVLICIDVLTLEKSMKKFWNVLETKLFLNEGLLKVVHDIRPMVDFLFHRKAMKTKNLFCTQLGELFIRSNINRDTMSKDVRDIRKKDNDSNWDAKTLSYCLEKFLPDYVNPIELTLLKEYEGKDFSVRNPLMDRPMKNDINSKSVAISMKYLLELHESQVKIMMSHYNQVVQQQVKLMVRGNMADHHLHITDPSQVAHNVQEKILEGKPLFVKEIDQN